MAAPAGLGAGAARSSSRRGGRPHPHPGALAITGYDAEDQRLTIGLTDGEPAAVTALLMAIRAYASQLGAIRVRAWLPEIEWLRGVFQAAGFDYGDWKGALWLFERRFGAPGGADDGL